MNIIEGIPYRTAEFDKEGKLLSQPSVPAGTTDLIVISHGWNNNRKEAETLYIRLFTNFVKVTATDLLIRQRKLAIIGIIWPSKKFNEFMTQPIDHTTTGSLAFADGVDKPASQTQMHAAIDLVAPLFMDVGDAERIAALHKLVPKLENDSDAQKDFVITLRELLDPHGLHISEQNADDSSTIFFQTQPHTIFQSATTPRDTRSEALEAENNHPNDSLGQLAGIDNFFSGVTHAVSTLLNLTTFYEMKQRAGNVGKIGLAPLLDQLGNQVERIHLAGHSFGARVVTSAAMNSNTDKLHTLALLQAAFSHNSFSKKRNGFFRSVVENNRISGPIFITHTKNDTSVGIAYPAAARISRDNAAFVIGDADDEFGALGSNGAQKMEDGEIFLGIKELLPTDQPYQWQMGKFHNLESSKFIIDKKTGGDAHGFVYGDEVAWALSRAIIS